MIAARKALNSGDVRWTRFDRISGGQFSLDAHFSGESVLCRSGRLGDSDSSRLGSLDHDGLVWQHQEGELEALVVPAIAGRLRLPDPRALGLDDIEPLGGVDDVLPRLLDTDASLNFVRWSEETIGDLVVVTGRVENRAVTIWIDPRRDWNPVLVQRSENGVAVQQCRSELREFEGIWYPERVECCRSPGEMSSGVQVEIQVSHAEFDNPSLAIPLAPESIGIEVGVLIAQRNEEFQPAGLQYWDGKKLVSQQELSQRLARGELKYGESVKRMHEQLRRESDLAIETTPELYLKARLSKRSTGFWNWSDYESAWRAYVRHFCDEHQLDDSQRQKAMEICSQSEARAAIFLNGKREQIKSIMERAKQILSKPAAERAAGERDLKDRVTVLLKPLDDIFEGDLKPRIEKLPTRAQRRAASRPAAVAPAAP